MPPAKAATATKPRDAIGDRIAAVRAKMAQSGIDVLLVRSTDRFLNEYVPLEESSRVWISGFTGSMGEVAITAERAYLAVDGRYHLQAEKETDPELYEVLKVQQSTSLDEAIADLLVKLRDDAKDKKLKIGFEPEKLTVHALEYLMNKVGPTCIFKPVFPSPIEAARGLDRPPPRDVHIRAIDEKRVGRSVKDKLAELGTHLEKLGVDAVLVQRLDEIAYLSNLRGDELPYQATFKAIALATKDHLFIAIDPARVPNAVRVARDDILFVPESELWTLIGKKTKRTRIAYDKSGNTVRGRAMIEDTGATAVACESPVAPMKARKNKAELAAMVEAFARADLVVDRAVRWLCTEVVAGNKVTEADFAGRVQALFEESGATGLSFRIISAAGKNGAIIHYSDPSDRRIVKRGELMLLDTGAYYEDGYATDLTRTFLVEGAGARGDEQQRRYYTLVLKAAIAGMTAVFPEGTRGTQLDAIVRAPIWAAGLNYNHGTGHGVGINVHEFPPRIGPGSQTVLEPGFVFSIEPGIYLPAFGGVRIENLCTIERVPKNEGFLRVVPMTYSPLDKRLIEPSLLTPGEKNWLQTYGKVHGSAERKRLRA